MTPRDEHDEESLSEELSVFGLSEGEINTYLAILSRGEATASAVADDADVTQRAVYNIAERLEDRGLVRVNDHASPTTVRAIPPDEAISNLSSKLESIRPALEDRFNHTEPKAPEIQMVKSRETALKRLRNAISQAKGEAIIAIPEYAYPEIESELRDAVDRGVFVLLLIGETDDLGSEIRFDGVADVVRCWNESFPLIYVVDNQNAMIGSTSILSSTHTDDDVVSVTQEGLAGSILGLFLSAYWPAGTEVFVTDPAPLPETYEEFRQVICHAFLHQRDETEIWADVETTTGEEVSGRVDQIRQALVEPSTNDFTLENSLYIETVDGTVTIGGSGSFIEDYEAESVTLRSGP